MGIAVIAIYGPTNPVKWAPWPFGYNQNTNPFMRVGSQQLNNIHLVQGQGDSVPCHLEGCDRHQRSRSVCLDSLSFEKITAVIDELLPL
jgi:heptosyltransferase-3